MELSIVIPAFNEQDRLPRTLVAIHSAFAAGTMGDIALHELIVVDDGSTDRTADVVGEWEGRLPVSVIRLRQNRGKGAAVRAGMLKAASPYVLFYDADGATPIEEVALLAQDMRSHHADIVIGSRVMGNRKALVSMSLHRRLIGRMYHFLCLRLVPGIEDAACGCKLFTQNAARSIFVVQHIDRFAFDIEVLAIAIERGYRIREVPVRWTEIPRSKVRVIRDGLQMFWCVLKLYVQRLIGR